MRDWIHRGIDGGITSFPIVLGIIGANFSINVIPILGAADIVADVFPIAARNYTGTKAENGEFTAVEEEEIINILESEEYKEKMDSLSVEDAEKLGLI